MALTGHGADTKLTDLWREKCFIVELVLHPGHEIIYILGSRALDWLLDVGPISPMVLISKRNIDSITLTHHVIYCVKFLCCILFSSPYLKKTYLGPADMTGQLSSVQKSVIVPYSILIWLKKSTAGKEGKNNILHVKQRWDQIPRLLAQIAGTMLDVPHFTAQAEL